MVFMYYATLYKKTLNMLSSPRHCEHFVSGAVVGKDKGSRKASF